jgi:hypothetical protein
LNCFSTIGPGAFLPAFVAAESQSEAANRFGFLIGNLVLHYGKGDSRER